MPSRAKTIPLRELLALQVAPDPVSQRTFEAQVRHFAEVAPSSLVINMGNGILLAWSIASHVRTGPLLTWLAALLLLGTLRIWRLEKLSRRSLERGKRPTYIEFLVGSALLGLLWLIPALAWFPQVPVEDKLVIGLLLAGMMSGGTLTLFAVPATALTYIALLTGGVLNLAAVIGSPVLGIMALVFGLAMSVGAIRSARLFFAQVRAGVELREQAELIALLRDFGASGSQWLWELDGELRLRHMPREMIEIIGRPARHLFGTPVFRLLDPRSDIVQVSAAMREIFEAFRANRSFRDVVVPVLDGQAWWSLSGKPMFDNAGKLLGWRGVGSDVTEMRLSGGDSLASARHDPLTGLGNRLLAREQLEQMLLGQLLDRSPCSALLLVDLDRFKLVNDTLGHAVGDRLLCEVARRLESAVQGAQVCRLGGDEFAILAEGSEDRDSLASLAEKVIACLSAPYVIGASELRIGATIGIASAPDDGCTQEELTRNADLALYRAKESGRGTFQFFARWMAEEAQAHRQLESDLREALQQGQLHLAYQPIVRAGGHDVVGREAMLRWSHPKRGNIPPDVFVPVIEDAGLMVQVGDWIIREACREAARWPDHARVAVNVSAAQLTGTGLLSTVVSALASSGLPAQRLELEVTESIFLADDAVTRDTLQRLRTLGIRLALDDFGTRYSSLGMLGRGEFAKIKIDRSFVNGAAAGKKSDRAIVEAIIALARGLDLDVTAEGIETNEEAEHMERMGCMQLQGFYFGRPMPADAIEQPTISSVPVRERRHAFGPGR